MSELKTRFIDDTYAEYYNTGKHDLAQVYIKAEVDAAIAELKAENQRLKKCEIWMKQHFFCEEVIACESAKNRRLKRALWLARAERAHVTTLLWNVYCYQNNCLYFRDFMNVKSNPFRNLPKKTAMEWSDLWESIETKCLDKAKEYK